MIMDRMNRIVGSALRFGLSVYAKTLQWVSGSIPPYKEFMQTCNRFIF